MPWIQNEGEAIVVRHYLIYIIFLFLYQNELTETVNFQNSFKSENLLSRTYKNGWFRQVWRSSKCIIFSSKSEFFAIWYSKCRPVASGGAGGARAPPLFDRSVNPISTRGGTLSPPSTMCPPGFSDLATALFIKEALINSFLVLLKKPGADRFARGTPGFFSRLHRKFLAQKSKKLRIQIWIST